MKKLVIIATALTSLSLSASELVIKGGYDFFKKEVTTNSDESNNFKGIPTIGLEYYFDNQGEFEWGLGAEHKVGFIKNKNDDRSVLHDATAGTYTNKQYRQTTAYATGKFNLITSQESQNDLLYVIGRVGYAFNKTSNEIRKESIPNAVDYKGGLYLAGGLGTEWGPLALEVIYERAETPIKGDYVTKGGKAAPHYIESVGARIGYRFGNLPNENNPKIKTIVTTITEPGETIIVERPTEPGIQQPNLVQLPFSCSSVDRKCVIKGFKVDGREPNAAEQNDLREIATFINRWADGGSIDFVGHTDNTGSHAYNQKLSVTRAQNVSRLLRQYGLKNSISYGTITGKSYDQPADTNGTVDGRYNNRRVELLFRNVDFENIKFN